MHELMGHNKHGRKMWCVGRWGEMGALYSVHTFALKGPAPRALFLRNPQKASEEGATVARATSPRSTPAFGAEKRAILAGSGLCVRCVVGEDG